MFASTIKENKFKIRLEYLKENGTEKKKKQCVRILQFFLVTRTPLEILVARSL